MQIKEFSFEINHICYGWEEIVLKFDDDDIIFEASYMGSEPISTMIISLVELENIEYEEEFTSYHTSWLDEPGELKIQFKRMKQTDELRVKIIFDKWDEHYEKRYEMQYSLYKNAVLNGTLKVLKRFGLKGFNCSWGDGYDTFPFVSFLSLLGAKVTFNEEEESYHSSLIDDIETLRQVLEYDERS